MQLAAGVLAGILAGGSGIVAQFCVAIGGGKVVVAGPQIVPEVVRRINSEGMVAQSDQGQEELQHQHGHAHCGTDHKDCVHGDLPIEELLTPASISLGDGKSWLPASAPA